LNPVDYGGSFNTTLELGTIKQDLGWSLPQAAATLRYSAHIKTDAVLRFGLYTLVGALRRLLNRSGNGEKPQERQALKDSIRKMKKEMVRSITSHCKDYKENLKFQYFEPLARTAGNRLFGTLTEHFSVYLEDVDDLAAAVENRRSDKVDVDRELDALDASAADLRGSLAQMRATIQSMVDDTVVLQKPASGQEGG